MIDFHSHILPEMDDGADSLETSLAMLRESKRQGVGVVCATSHFYADEEDPQSFLARRSAAYAHLQSAMDRDGDYPKILLGAEVLYFPGISVAEEMKALRLMGTPFLLIEPPMMPWTEAMLDEVEACGSSLNCIPVIAHIDRYMRMLRDYTLFDRVADRKLLVQVNASFFLHRDTQDFALECLEAECFHFIGSDCHDLTARRPNLGDAAEIIRAAGLSAQLSKVDTRLAIMLEQAMQRDKSSDEKSST